MEFFSGVVLLGARQVGKTTLARAIAERFPRAIFLDLENRVDRNRMGEPELFFAAHRHELVVLDEVQHVPELFSVLRPEIDADRRPGRFLLLWSASGKLLRQTSDSLAGRVAYLEMAPLTAHEVGAGFGDLQHLWLRGGFPDSFGAPSDSLSFQWRENFIRTLLGRDLPELGVTISPQVLHRFLRMLAHNHAQLFNANQIGAALGSAHSTVLRYLDLMKDTLIVRRLEPLYVNLGKRLVKAPKVYVRDSGLLHAILDIRTLNDLQGHPVAGHSWEGFIIEQIVAQAPALADISFYRTAAGAELDLVLSLGERRFGFEIKFSAAPKPARGFWQARKDLGLEQAYVVAPVQEGYSLEDKVEVVAAHQVSQVIAGLALNHWCDLFMQGAIKGIDFEQNSFSEKPFNSTARSPPEEWRSSAGSPQPRRHRAAASDNN